MDESRAATIEQLRRRMAAIPARSAGPNRTSLAALTCTTPASDTAEPSTDRRPAASLRTLPAPAPIADLLPHRGLVRGSTIHITGVSSLRAGLIAAVTGGGGWAAIVGNPGLGLLAAAEMGADLRRCAVIGDLDSADPVEVAAVLVDGVDLVVLSLAGADVSLSRARTLTARTRRNDSVLAVIDGRWPTVDQHLDARVAGYAGLGEGRGRITGISLDIEATARGRRTRRARVELAGGQGTVSWRRTEHRTEHAIAPMSLRVAQ